MDVSHCPWGGATEKFKTKAFRAGFLLGCRHLTPPSVEPAHG